MATKIIKQKIKAQNRHWKNFQDKDYLGSHNLEEGEEMLLTIERFEGEEKVIGPDGKETVKMVLYFRENVPKMIMNITNGTTIASLYGPHPEDWVGKQIQLYPASVTAFGKTGDALRVRDFKPKHDVDMDAVLSVLQGASSLAERKTMWSSLEASERTAIGEARLKELKSKLS